jgi:hypothetical protein
VRGPSTWNKTTEHDRALMQEAWDMMAAHREELVTRMGAPAEALPAPPAPAPLLAHPRPSVLDMLRRGA